MSDKTEAAQKWAEAKSALESADQALALAKAEYAKCEDAEFHAWQELEALSGRTSPKPQATHVGYVTGPGIFQQQNQPVGRLIEQSPLRHSLPLKPIG